MKVIQSIEGDKIMEEKDYVEDVSVGRLSPTTEELEAEAERRFEKAESDAVADADDFAFLLADAP